MDSMEKYLLEFIVQYTLPWVSRNFITFISFWTVSSRWIDHLHSAELSCLFTAQHKTNFRALCIEFHSHSKLFFQKLLSENRKLKNAIVLSNKY
jgi:hypothetical protein